MSEYQYYEFQAIDRPLTAQEQAQVRALSTRATITPTRFVNVYHYGDFSGDPHALMERYYDAFVYVANWGTHWCMMRLPRALLDPDATLRYCFAGSTELHVKGDNVIVEFRSEDESGESWDEAGEEWMASIALVRDSLANGDLRALYLGWLAAVSAEAGYSGTGDGADGDDWDEAEDEDTSGPAEDEIEPPVPPGLGQLSAPLKAFAEFLRLDDDLLAVAAAGSAPLREAGPSARDFERWVAALPSEEQTALLVRLVASDEPHLQVRGALLRRFREEWARAHPATAPASGAGRSVAAMITEAGARAEARRREERERVAREQARQQREAAARRAAFLDELAPRAEATWAQVEELIDTKRPKDYDQAASLLIDLRDLAARQQSDPAFAARLAALRARHAKKPSLIERFDRAGLPRG